MPDFASLLKRPAGEGKRPVVLPMGDYQGIISGAHSTGESSQKKTPFVRFPLRLLEWPEDAPDSWSETDSEGNIVEVNREDVDLGARTSFGAAFYLTDAALFMLDDFIKSCGIESEGRDYEEILPELIGQRVLVTVEKGLNERTNRFFNSQDCRVRGLSGA